MARFDMEQTMAWVAIQQLVNEWGQELDANNGLKIGNLVTEECAYTVRGVQRKSRAEVEAFYRARLKEFTDAGKEPPLQRHVQSNLQVAFTGSDSAAISFTLVYFTSAMVAAGADPADPTAVADVRMETQRCPDGHWRIAMFDSAQCLVRVAG
jgi:uncharacterized protein (TIGR02246 family)